MILEKDVPLLLDAGVLFIDGLLGVYSLASEKAAHTVGALLTPFSALKNAFTGNDVVVAVAAPPLRQRSAKVVAALVGISSHVFLSGVDVNSLYS